MNILSDPVFTGDTLEEAKNKFNAFFDPIINYRHESTSVFQTTGGKIEMVVIYTCEKKKSS